MQFTRNPYIITYGALDAVDEQDPSTISVYNSTTESVTDDDVYFQTNEVCILKPNVKKGIIIKHSYGDRALSDVMTDGLRSGKNLKKNGIDFGRTRIHDCIFFRSPYLPILDTQAIDRSSVQSEIITSFGTIDKKCVYIRVDPTRTYTFSSEIRAKFKNPHGSGMSDEKATDIAVNNSKKLLTKYFDVLEQNKHLTPTTQAPTAYWNLFSSKKQYFPTVFPGQYPWDVCAIERNSEVLVKTGQLSSDSFVWVED